MATFIKGLNDELPVYAPTVMDYSFLGKALDALQTRYDKSVDRWKSMYSSIMNRELSSADNQQFRADYLKKADGYLNQVAMVDLTNAANMQQAMNLFDPLVNDKEYVTDLYKTQQQNMQLSRNAQAKDDMAKDPTKSTYSPIMEKYLMIGKERLSKTKRGDGSIEKAAIHQWSPWINYYDYVTKLAKDQGLKIKEEDTQGMYLVTTTNGLTKQNISTFSQWAKNATGTTFDNQFRVEAVVKADDAVKNLMAENSGMTEDVAIRQLAGEQADAYVKEYNSDMSDLQYNIDMIDNEMRKYKKQYPNGLDPRLVERVDYLREQKQAYSDRLDNMRNNKVSDDDLKKKTTDLFVSNPGQMYYGSVKNSYAQQFAYNWAANSEVTKTADPVKMQEDSQAFQWGLEKWKSQQEDRRKQEDRDFEIEKMQLKGEIVGTTGVESGPQYNLYPTDKDVPTVESAYSSEVAKRFDEGRAGYMDPIVLGVAANIGISKSGQVAWPGNLNYQLLRSAIEKKSTNSNLSDGEAKSLQTYLGLIGNSGVDASTVGWNTLSKVITSAIKRTKGNDPTHGSYAFKRIQESNTSRDAYVQMSRNMNDHLTSMLQSNPNLAPYMVRNNYGFLSLNYDAINKSPNAKQLYNDLLVPQEDARRIAIERGKSMQSIVLNVSDPKKFDFGLYQRIIDNATEIGVTGTVKGGMFSSDQLNQWVKMDENQTNQFKQLAFGGKNLSEVFGTSGTALYRQKINGKDYIVAKVPIIREASGKEPRKMSEVLGFNVSKDVEGMNSNFLEFRIPVESASKILGPQKSYVKKSTGERVMIDDPFREKMLDMLGQSSITPARSWVSTLRKSSEVSFPSSMQTSVDGKMYTTNDGNLWAEFIFENKSPVTVDITRHTNGIKWQDLNSDSDGAYADEKVRRFLIDLVEQYDAQNMSNDHNRVTNNGTAARTNRDYIPWTDKRLNF
jgi:hypothetical protein